MVTLAPVGMRRTVAGTRGVAAGEEAGTANPAALVRGAREARGFRIRMRWVERSSCTAAGAAPVVAVAVAGVAAEAGGKRQKGEKRVQEKKDKRKERDKEKGDSKDHPRSLQAAKGQQQQQQQQQQHPATSAEKSSTPVP